MACNKWDLGQALEKHLRPVGWSKWYEMGSENHKAYDQFIPVYIWLRTSLLDHSLYFWRIRLLLIYHIFLRSKNCNKRLKPTLNSSKYCHSHHYRPALLLINNYGYWKLKIRNLLLVLCKCFFVCSLLSSLISGSDDGNVSNKARHYLWYVIDSH